MTSEEQARQRQLDFLESMKVFEEVYEERVAWLRNTRHVRPLARHDENADNVENEFLRYTARGYEEPHSDEGCFAATATMQGIRMLLARCLDKRDQGHEAFVAGLHTSFSQR